MNTIPESLQSAFFKPELIPILFPMETEFYLQNQRDWTIGEEDINKILHHWNENVKPLLLKYHSSRNSKQSLPWMIEGLSIFFCLLFWTNDAPVKLQKWENELDDLTLVPLNTKERVQFIMRHPVLHHSFIQLSELIVEMEKLYRKSLIIKKRK